MDIFNKLGLAEKSATLRALFVIAIGHKTISLLQQMADKAFITPIAFGKFINETYNHTIEEAEHSKARLVDAVKAQLTAGYQKQIDNLNEQLKGGEQLKTGAEQPQNEKLILLNKQISDYKAQVETLEKKPRKTGW